MTDELKVIGGFLRGLRPIPRLDPSEWADKNRYLTSAASAEAGLWRTSRTPYLREIMNCFSPYDPVETVVFMKGAQIGASEAGFNLIGYYIAVVPCPIMYVMPTEGVVKRNSKTRIRPMLRDSPSLAKKVAPVKSRDAANTILQVDFEGGTLMLAGANSSSALRSVPVRFLVLDEVDAFPSDLDGEGSPIELATARTRTFSSRKIFMLSTPTLETNSAIAPEFDNTDKRFYHVPCPECHTLQIITWGQMRFDAAANPVRQVHLECLHCRHLIEERHKPWMLKNGQWIATAPENADPKRVGFHLSGLYSPLGWYSWSQAANEFLTATREQNQLKLKVFVNTVLGETWKEKAVVPEYTRLYERRGGYQSGTVPDPVCVLTAGADVQADRIEVEVVGWGPDLSSWSINYIILEGPTDQPEVWAALKKVLAKAYPRADGSTIGIYRTAIDSGYNTNHVYKFCRRVGGYVAVPVKGQSGASMRVMLSKPTPVDIRENGKRVGKTTLTNVGVDVIKAEIYGFLNAGLTDDGLEPPGFCHFPEDYGIAYFRMLTAERMVERKNPKGFSEYVWEKTQERNEALDARVYARAAAALIGVDRWDEKHWQAAKMRGYAPPKLPVDEAPTGQPATQPPAAPRQKTRKKSSFW